MKERKKKRKQTRLKNFSYVSFRSNLSDYYAPARQPQHTHATQQQKHSTNFHSEAAMTNAIKSVDVCIFPSAEIIIYGMAEFFIALCIPSW